MKFIFIAFSNKLKDFSNKKVAAQKGTEQEKIAQQEIENADISSLNRLPDATLSCYFVLHMLQQQVFLLPTLLPYYF
jgi:hypothetical protein